MDKGSRKELIVMKESEYETFLAGLKLMPITDRQVFQETLISSVKLTLVAPYLNEADLFQIDNDSDLELVVIKLINELIPEPKDLASNRLKKPITPYEIAIKCLKRAIIAVVKNPYQIYQPTAPDGLYHTVTTEVATEMALAMLPNEVSELAREIKKSISYVNLLITDLAKAGWVNIANNPLFSGINVNDYWSVGQKLIFMMAILIRRNFIFNPDFSGMKADLKNEKELESLVLSVLVDDLKMLPNGVGFKYYLQAITIIMRDPSLAQGKTSKNGLYAILATRNDAIPHGVRVLTEPVIMQGWQQVVAKKQKVEGLTAGPVPPPGERLQTVGNYIFDNYMVTYAFNNETTEPEIQRSMQL